MKFFHRITSLCILVLSSYSYCPAQTSQPKPNIVVITVDDLGWSDLGCYGSTYYETRHIDGLAREGMTFTAAYAAAAICSPTRAALMTGKYPARIGITDWIRAGFQGGNVPENGKNPTAYVSTPGRPLKCPPNPLFMELRETTIAEHLQQTGYTTAHIGKWHLGPEKWYPTEQGFIYNIGGSDLGQPPSYFDPYEDYTKDSVWYNIPTLKPRKTGEYLTDREGDEAVNFIAQHADKPFFLHWAPYAVHTPIQGKKELVEKYKKKQGGKQNNPVYAAIIESLDENVGKILRCLDSLKLSQNTLIIFTSDNGGLLPITDNSPLRSGKGYPYEGGLRIPLLVRWPGQVQAGSQQVEPVISMDIFATLLEVSGSRVTKDKKGDGISLIPLLKNTSSSTNRDLFWHFPHYRGEDVTPYSVVRSGDYKLIKYYDTTAPELYNLKTDPAEQQNIYTTDKTKSKGLESKLDKWLKEVNAKLPTPAG
jgi:arylsulfatase A-like enzyme